jgi:hypothetical protein
LRKKRCWNFLSLIFLFVINFFIISNLKNKINLDI